MLYGAINVSPQKAPEYFKEATAGLKQMQLLKEAEKKQEEATEKAARAAMLDPSEVNFASTWNSAGGAAQDAAQQLRDMKDELMKTEEGRAQYNTYLNELTQFIELAEEDYKQTYPVFINNTNVLRAGNEYEDRMQDVHNLAFYEDKAKLDDNKNRYKVRFEGGHMVLDDGSGPMRFNDPRIFNTQRYDAKLERMDPVNPDTFYRQSAYQPYVETREQAKQAIKDALTTRRSRLDAIEWWLRNDPGGEKAIKENPGLTSELILDVTENGGYLGSAMEAYEEAALKGWQNMTKDKKDKKDKKDGKKTTKYNHNFGSKFDKDVLSKIQDFVGDDLSNYNNTFKDPPQGVIGRSAVFANPINLGQYYLQRIDYDAYTGETYVSLSDKKDPSEGQTFEISYDSDFEIMSGSDDVPDRVVGAFNPQVYFDSLYGEDSYDTLLAILMQEGAAAYADKIGADISGYNEEE